MGGGATARSGATAYVRGCAILALIALAALPARGQAVERRELSTMSGGQRVVIEKYAAAEAGMHPAVVMLHGAHGPDVLPHMYETYGRSLAAQGIDALLVHYYDRAGYDPKAPREERRRVYFEHYEAWIEAIRDAIGRAAAEPDIDAGRIGLLGFSRGGYLAVAAANRDSRVRAVVEFYGGVPEPEQGKLGRLPPILMLHGDADRTVAIDEGHALERALKASGSPYAIKIYPGMGHGFNARFERPEAWDALALTLGFFKRNL